MDQRATETRKGSCAVRRQREEGRKQEGEMELGGIGEGREVVEKTGCVEDLESGLGIDGGKDIHS